jgi:hypothetical protein
VSALSVAQLLSFDSITVSRNDESAHAAKFRLTRDTLPTPLQERLDDKTVMVLPPDFSAVEKCLLPAQRAENGSCADKFSNPKYFENEWLVEQEARMQVLKEEKRRRREERKARKLEEKKTGQKQPKLKGSGAKLNWREAAKKNVGDDIVFENR